MQSGSPQRWSRVIGFLGAGAMVMSTALAACTPQALSDMATLMPADPAVSFAAHGSKVLASSQIEVDSVVFPVTASENPRIPIALQATNGDIVAIASVRMGSIGDAAAKEFRAAISSDGGNTWIHRSVSGGPITAGSDPSGVIDPATGRIHLVDTNQYTSADNGQTWSTSPTVILPNAQGVKGTPNGPGAGIALTKGAHAGRLVIMCRVSLPDSVRNPLGLPAQWINWSDSTNCVLYSDDGGATWTTSTTVQGSVGEGAVVELADGTLYMSSRTYLFDGRRSEAFSYDGGQTWTDMRRSVLPEPFFGVNGALTRVQTDDGGDAVVYSNIPEWEAPLGDIPGVRKDLSLYVSTDSAQSWRFGAVLHKGPSAYSSLVPLTSAEGKAQVGILYEAVVQGINSDRGAGDPPEGIRFARVNVEDLLG